MPTRRDDWIDEDEYPDDRDIEDFGEDSPPDDNPLTIGYNYTGKRRVPFAARTRFWTPGKLIMLLIALLILAALLLPLVMRL